MRPKLVVVPFEKKVNRSEIKKSFKFVIIDAENPKGYPHNFICILPRVNGHSSIKCLSVLGEKWPEIGEKIINEALVTTKDPKVIKEINALIKEIRKENC